ncbi:hypothetical protein DPMN_169084 [Dreissena polymorpha]|uniref:Uncharacterized protein n=1 Tax=Dreissena polymorpha TaxID=45954 RepID=A0A9D4F3W7_DREPO|nr:hypothetical protein DPMN_169084 [Dreissena polymorpha]
MFTNCLQTDRQTDGRTAGRRTVSDHNSSPRAIAQLPRSPRFHDPSPKHHLVDGPTDRPTDRHMSTQTALSSDNHLVDGRTDRQTDRHEQSNIPPLLRRGA